MEILLIIYTFSIFFLSFMFSICAIFNYYPVIIFIGLLLFGDYLLFNEIIKKIRGGLDDEKNEKNI